MQKEEPETNKVQIKQCKSLRFRNELSNAFDSFKHKNQKRIKLFELNWTKQKKQKRIKLLNCFEGQEDEESRNE